MGIDHRPLANGQVFADTHLPPKDHLVLNNGFASNANLSRKKTVLSDHRTVTDVNMVVQFGAVADDRISAYTLVYGATGTNFHSVANDHPAAAFQLVVLNISFFPPFKVECIRSDDCSCVDDHIISNHRVIIDRDIRVYEAVAPNANMVPYEGAWLHLCTLSYGSGITDHFISGFERAEVFNQLHVGTEGIGMDEQAFAGRTVDFLIDQNNGCCRLKALIIVLFKIYEGNITRLHLMYLVESCDHLFCSSGKLCSDELSHPFYRNRLFQLHTLKFAQKYNPCRRGDLLILYLLPGMRYYNYNGRLADSEGAQVTGPPAPEHGFFETMLVLNGTIQLANYHSDRLAGSLERAGMPAVFKVLPTQEITATVQANGAEACCRVRLQVFPEADLQTIGYLIEVFPVSPDLVSLNSRGLRLALEPHLRRKEGMGGNDKHIDNIFYKQSSEKITQHRSDDILLLNKNGNVTESSIANIFWVRNGAVFTPPLSEGCVAGVMRRFLSDNTKVTEKPLTIEALRSADEVFLTNAVRRIKWVGEIEGKSYANVLVSTIHSELLY